MAAYCTDINDSLIQIPLAPAAARIPRSGCGLLRALSAISADSRHVHTYNGHAQIPAVIVANGLEQAAAIVLQSRSEEGSTSLDVEVLL